MSNEELHRIIRGRGNHPIVVRIMSTLVYPLMRLIFQLRVSGAENIPVSGPAVIAPNHKSFFDSFFVAASTSRPMYGMGKSELFQGRRAHLLLGLGGFPVRRGESDSEATETARILLRKGELVQVFPEGTRVSDASSLGNPKRGAARLAIETGSPIIPVAIFGTEKRALPWPRRVHVTFAEPISVAELEATPEAAGELIDDVVWPEIEQEYDRLRAHPGMIAAGLAATGLAVFLYRRRNR